MLKPNKYNHINRRLYHWNLHLQLDNLALLQFMSLHGHDTYSAQHNTSTSNRLTLTAELST